MKISNFTLSVLKNFATINPNLLINPGNKILTYASSSALIAKVECEEEFPVEIGIYDLNRFLNVVSLHKDPDFDFGQKMVTISSGNISTRYFYAAKNTLNYFKYEKVNMPSIDVELNVTAENLSSVVKAANIMGAEFISLSSENGDIYLSAMQKDLKGDKYSIKLDGSTKNTFNMHLYAPEFKLLIQDYSVKICRSGYVEFSNDRITYWVAADKISNFA